MKQLGIFTKYPLILPFVYLLFGIILFLRFRNTLQELTLPIIGSIGLILFLTIKYKSISNISLLISTIFFCLGLSLTDYSIRKYDKEYVADLSYPRRIEGKIIAHPVISKSKASYRIRVLNSSDSLNNELKGAIVEVSQSETGSNELKGQIVNVLLPLKKIQRKKSFTPTKFYKGTPPANFKSYIKSNLEIEKVTGVASLSPVSALRKKFIDLLSLEAPKESNLLLQGVLLGNKKSIPKSVKESFKKSGIFHLLVISGLHIGMIFGFFFFLIKLILSRFERLLVKYDVKNIALVGALIPAILYAAIAGFPYPTLRAMFMLSALIIYKCIFRIPISLNALFAGGIIILLSDPFAVCSISFQLSFSAVLGIIVGMERIKPFLQYEKKELSLLKNYIMPLRNYFLLVMFCSMFATAFTAPLLIYYFKKISLIGVVTNLLAVPLFNFAVIPCGFLALLSGLIFSARGNIFLKIAEFSAEFLIGFAKSVSNFRWAFIEVPTIYPEDVILLYALLLSLIYIKMKTYRIIPAAVSLLLLIGKILIQ